MNPHEIHEKNCNIVQRSFERCGCKCLRHTPSVDGVDLVVTPRGGKSFKVQVRARLYLIQKHCGRQMHIAFPEGKEGGRVVYYSVDEMVQEFHKRWKSRNARVPKSWDPRGVYHIDPTPDWVLESCALRRITPNT